MVETILPPGAAPRLDVVVPVVSTVMLGSMRVAGPTVVVDVIYSVVIVGMRPG